MARIQIKNDTALRIVKNLRPGYQTCDRRFEARQKYMFSRPLAFSTIPKACGFEAATRFPSILLGGSLIPIVVYRDGDGFSLAKHVPAKRRSFGCTSFTPGEFLVSFSRFPYEFKSVAQVWKMPGNGSSKFDSDGPGLYVHVPFCRAKCHYCGFYSRPIAEYDAGAVVRAMIAEMERIEPGDGIKTIYIGGGSPSALEWEHLFRLVGRAKQQCPAAKEFTVEVNPGQVDMELLCELRTAGVNRLSIGAQSLIQRELDFLGRGHTVDCTRRVVRQGRSAGFDNISLDLIFAVPGTDLDSWKQNLRSAIELQPDHISAYGLSYEDGAPLSRDLAAGLVEAVDEDTDRAMFELTIDELAQAGIDQYEISNFAKHGFECRHNLNYWANGSYVGIGPDAASYLRGTRSSNFADIDKYVRAVTSGESTIESSETLSDIERTCETAVLNLRRRRGIDLAQFKSQTGYDALQLFAEPIRRYRKIGLIERTSGRVSLTRQALGIADSILCDFALV